MNTLPKKNILGVGVTNANKDEVLQYITRSLENSSDSYYIVTPNPEILVYAHGNVSFQEILNRARIALPDGVGLMMAAWILGKRLSERIPGVDFLEMLCRDVSALNAVDTRKPITVGFLGGRDGVAEKTAECLKGKYPGLQVAFIGEEWGEDGFDRARKYQVAGSEYPVSNKVKEIQNTKYKIQATTIDILFVAFGFPKQEEWMAKHVGKIPVKVMMGVGGAFDYLSGSVPRAPYLLRAIGLEWFYRLIRQPWRLRRQIKLLSFVRLVIKELRR